MRKRVLMTGETGMIGGLLIDLCLQSPEVAKVVSLGRRLTGTDDPKLNEV